MTKLNKKKTRRPNCISFKDQIQQKKKLKDYIEPN